jgi:hypothetical protein
MKAFGFLATTLAAIFIVTPVATQEILDVVPQSGA